MEENKSADEIINRLKNREKKSVLFPIFLYALAVIIVIGLSISIYKYTDNKFRSIQEKYDALVQEIDEDIKELKAVNENRITEMDKVLSEADSGLKKEIKMLWSSAYKKNKDAMKKLENEFGKYKTDQEQNNKTITGQIVELDNKENKTIENIRNIQTETAKIEKSLKKSIAEVKKMEISINETLKEAKAYSDTSIDSSTESIRDKLQGYTLEILNIKDELNRQKDELLKMKEHNTKLQKVNKELSAELQRIKDNSLVLDPDKAVGTDTGQ